MMAPMEAYPLPARPLPTGTDVSPVVDLRGPALEVIEPDSTRRNNPFKFWFFNDKRSI